jgi:tetratricopeptide (TPR) repeat protein
VIFAVAFGVRLLHLWSIQRAPFFDLLIGDARGYDAWARQIAGGDWVGHAVFYQAPLYPYFLAAIYRTAGDSLMTVRVLQAVVGSCASVLVGLAAGRFFSPTVGAVAGLTLALYAPAIFFDSLLQKSVLDVFFVCLALWLIAVVTSPVDSRDAGKATVWPWLALGLALGCLGLTRENALVFIVTILAWAARRFAARATVVAAVGLAIVLLPVAARNRIVGGGFYLTTSQFGPNLFIGNHPGADGTYQPLRFGRGAPEYEREDATQLAELAKGRSLTPREVSGYWTDRAVTFITSEPAAWAKLMARKVALLFNSTEMADTEDQATYADWSIVLRVLGPVSRFGILVPMAVVGMILTWSQRSRLGIVYAMLVVYAASVTLFYVFARYRYPLVPILVLFSSAGAVRLFRLMQQASARQPTHARLSVTGLKAAAVIATAVAVNWPIESTAAMRAVTASNLGLALDADHRTDEAIAQYRRAIAGDPTYAASYANLATALREQQRTDEAIAVCEQALRLQPEMVAARYTLANLLLDKGKPAAAIEQFQRAIHDEPISADADVQNNLGIAFASTGRLDEAVRAFQHALTLAPEMSGAHYNLANVLLQRGDAAGAIGQFQRAVDLDPTSEKVREALARALNDHGIALGSQGQFAAAVEAFRRAIALEPDFQQAQHNLATALHAAKSLK